MSGAIPVTITWLDMTAPPKLWFPVPVNLQSALMRAHHMPLPFYRHLYRQVGHRWKWVDRLRLSDADLAAIIHSDTTNVTILYIHGSPAGFFELNRRDADVVELEYFGLMERALGLGIGKWFLQQALDAAWTMGPQKVRVCTNTADHPRALQLYQRFGFSPVATEKAEILPLTEAEELDLLRRDLAGSATRPEWTE